MSSSPLRGTCVGRVVGTSHRPPRTPRNRRCRSRPSTTAGSSLWQFLCQGEKHGFKRPASETDCQGCSQDVHGWDNTPGHFTVLVTSREPWTFASTALRVLVFPSALTALTKYPIFVDIVCCCCVRNATFVKPPPLTLLDVCCGLCCCQRSKESIKAG